MSYIVFKHDHWWITQEKINNIFFFDVFQISNKNKSWKWWEEDGTVTIPEPPRGQQQRRGGAVATMCRAEKRKKISIRMDWKATTPSRGRRRKLDGSYYHIWVREMMRGIRWISLYYNLLILALEIVFTMCHTYVPWKGVMDEA